MNTVTHSKFGTGTIISQDSNNVTVDFSGTIKTLIIKFANLKNEDGSTFGVQFAAPAKSAKKVNKANFMSKEEFAKSRYATMSDNDFNAERQQAAYNSISW